MFICLIVSLLVTSNENGLLDFHEVFDREVYLNMEAFFKIWKSSGERTPPPRPSNTSVSERNNYGLDLYENFTRDVYLDEEGTIKIQK